MASRRMFSDKVIKTDAFMEMPHSTKNLYFYLMIEADDDGFVSNPKTIMRMLGANDDDYKILVAKRFIIPFQSGVCVIKHWLIHNLIRADRKVGTQWVNELSTLKIDKNTKKYSLAEPLQPSDNQVTTKRPHRLGKVRLGKDSITTDEASSSKEKKLFSPLGAEVIKAFEEIDPKNKNYYNNTSQRAAADFLIAEYTFGEVQKRISFLPKSNKIPFFPTITTPVQLRDKWVQLEDAVVRYKQKGDTSNQVAF